MIYCRTFAYTPAKKTLEDFPEINDPASYTDVQVAFIQLEEGDMEREKEVETKLVKNLKWVCGKNATKKIILHSFAHLSESKADPVFTSQFFSKAQERLEATGYEVNQTPFGYFLDLQLDAPGFSLARVFKDL